MLQMLAVMLGASLVLFTCLFVLPGDPIAAVAGDGPMIDPATRARLSERYHLDESLPSQYLHWAGRVFQGDLGESYRLRRPVTEVLGEKVGNTVDLAVAALLFETVIGILAGALAAAFRRSVLDTAVQVATTLALAVPAFLIGLSLQRVFAVRLGWLPLHGRDGGFQAILLPALTLGAINAAMVARLMRAALVEVLRTDYIRTARATGLGRRAVARYALRNSVVPVVTYLGVGFGGLLGGAAITEIIFQWDGLGRAMVSAIAVQDNPVVLGVVIYSVVAFVVVNLVADLLHVALDPRVHVT